MSLVETQRRLWRLVTAPSGVARALAEECGPAPLETVIRDDRLAAAATRLDVYASAYFYRIHAVLEKDYPALASNLGGDPFNDLVTSYLLVHPPTKPSLRHAGADLARFLTDHVAADGFRRRAPWAADLARLEWAMIEAFDATDRPRLTREMLAALAPEEFVDLALAFRPDACLLSLDWPVDELRLAHDRGEQPRSPKAPETTELLVWRRAERVRYRRTDPPEAVALGRLADGIDFATLCDELAREVDLAQTPALAAGLLERWLEDGFLEDTRRSTP